MKGSYPFLLMAFLALVLSSLPVESSEATEGSVSCNGSIAECSLEEFYMDTEINARILVDTIKYPAIAAGDGLGEAFESSKAGGSYNNPCYKANRCKGDIYLQPK
ncbi:hypothetical protein H6P81_019206 [Aristolochia fimbriata]|uniref:Uncharacterized protein n=1 Tax=Aristolochia fimbriata TaxID=158543 RepID=A0AAV7DS81_ARIFI|nr:hypothetical protein H6P81_019206 [Aristolochia fimbriata]